MTAPSKHFQTEHLNADLKRRSVRGGAVTIIAQVCKFLLGTGSTMILAWMLTPQDYGLIGMVAAVTGFAVVFKDLGLSTATIQRAEINHAQVSTLFWLNVGLGFGIGLIVAALAPVIAWFYHEPRLTRIGLLFASMFVLSGLTVQHQALLQRQMRFVAQTVVDITALLAGIVTAIILAKMGTGYWALAFMSLAMSVTTVLGVWIACRWRPGPPVHNCGIRSMLVFGGHLTGFDFLNYFARNLDNVLIGRYWGSAALGFYSKAYNLLLMPMQQINSPVRAVAVPALSRLQDDPQQFRNYYLKAVALITVVTMPMVMLFILLSEEIIFVVLGPQWQETAQIFRLLGIAALVQPILNTAGWLYVSTGQTARMFRWGAFSSPCIVAAFVIGLPFGVQGVAACYALVILLLTWPCIWYGTRGTPVAAVAVFAAAGRPALAAFVAVLPCVALKYWLGNRLSPLILIAVSLAVATGVYCWFLVCVMKMKDYYLSVLTHFRTASVQRG